MNKWLQAWRADRLRGAVELFWLLTVVSSFFGDTVIAVRVPAIGALYPFRVLLPITALLYVIWMVRRKEPLFRGISTVEKWCYGLIAIMILYGGVSLFRALEPAWTFRRLFNLCMDLGFFFLVLRLCRDKRLRHATMLTCAGMLMLLCLLGIVEVFCGGIVNESYDNYKRFYLFDKMFQFPIVFSGNTNDYSTTIIFLSAILLLYFCSGDYGKEKHLSLWIILYGVIVYFVVVASNARLCMIAYYILLCGAILYYLIKERRKAWLMGLLVLNVLFIQFATNYMDIVPPIQKYVAELKEYQSEMRTANSSENTDKKPKSPKLSLGNPDKRTLADEFYEFDSKTGAKKLSTKGSAGVRTRLLLHSFRCFRDSYGLGVGLGNTEIMAKEQEVIPDARIWSIHCFIARIIGDYGLFAAVPLTVIAVMLIKQGIVSIIASRRKSARPLLALAALYLVIMLCYPVVSTASSDAQDILSMWLYLGMLVIIGNACLDKKQIGENNEA